MGSTKRTRQAQQRPMLLVEPPQQRFSATQNFEPTPTNIRGGDGSSGTSSRRVAEHHQSSDQHYVIENHRSSTKNHAKQYSEAVGSEREEAAPEESTNKLGKDQAMTKRHKLMRNNKLTSMLVILFGLALLAATTVSSKSGPPVPSNVTASTRGASLGDTGETTIGPGEELTTRSGEESTEPDNEPVDDNDKHRTRLGSLIVDTAGEAVDKILIEGPQRLAAAAASASESDSESSNDERKEEESDLSIADSGNSTTATGDQEEPINAFEFYRRWLATGDDIIELFSRKVLPVIMEHGYDLDPVSMANFLQIYNAIRAKRGWALKLLDAWTKITPGILMGTQSDFGDFDECLSVRVDNPSGLNEDDVGRGEVDPTTGLRSTTVVGRYCIADVIVPKPPRVRLQERNEELQTDFAPIELRRPLVNFSETADFKDTIFVETGNFLHMLYVDPIRVGFCLTNKLDPDGLANIFNKLVKDFGVTIDFRGRCVTKYDKPVWSVQQTVSAYVLLVACSLVLLSTLLDLLHMKLNKLPLPSRRFDVWKLNFRSTTLRYQPLFTSFSIIRNTRRLFKRQQPRLAQQQQQLQHRESYLHNSVITAELAKSMALCSTSTSATGGTSRCSGGGESSSLESSSSIERRSSLASSAVNLISDSQQAAKSSQHLASFVGSQVVAPAAMPTKEKLGRRENNLDCLHGIRVITMTWMIVNHTYLFGGFFVLWAHRRLIDIAEWPKSLSFQLVLNGWLTVETYFFLSAAIIVLNVMPLMKSKKFAYFSYILHRLIRLLPAYVGLVCLNFLWPLISTGPVWLVKGRSFIQTPCENNLWTNFLFINNWIWPEKQCMVHTWFLSADFQLYLMAPIIVYLLYRRPVFGHTLNIIVAILASVLSGFVIYANKLMPATLINKLEFDYIKQQLSYSYFATYQHMGPYCLGIFIGYLLYKRPQVQLPKHLTWCLWLLLPPLSFTTLMLTYLWNGAYDEPTLINPSPIVSAFYVAIHRTIWTSLLAWIVFACATGRAKLMSSFLSNPIFIPLSRLSFSIYLVHLPVIMFRALNLRHTIEWTDSNILWEACGNFVVSLVFGFFLNIFFESPIINLERVVFGRPSTTTRDNFQYSGAKCMGRGRATLTEGSFTQKLSDNSDAATESSASSSSSSQSRECTDKASPKLYSNTQKWNHLSARGLADHDYKKSDLVNISENSQHQQQQHGLPDRLSSISTNLEHQMAESMATTKTSLEMSAQQVAPSDGSEQHTPTPPTTTMSRERLRRFSQSFHVDPSPNMESMQSSVESDSLYPVPGILPPSRFHQQYQQQHPDRPYSGAAFNQQQQQQFRDPYAPRTWTRPQQYATLARTSRPSQDEWPLSNRAGDYGSPYVMNGHKSRSHIGETPAHRLPTTTNMRNGLAYSSQRHSAGGGGQRPSKYNTLTSAGSWQSGSSKNNNNNRYLPAQNDWLQPGALLPRIDCSTLRRQQKLPAPQQEAPQPPTSASIAEELASSLDDHDQ